jgi:DnaJ-domain-containing protein 1
MSKAKDTQKAVKKEPAKSMKEKKAAKQAKKGEKTKFTPQ